MNAKIKNQLLLNIFVLLAGAVFAVVLVLGNVGRISANVAVVPGSYGEQYATSNKLNVVPLSDSEKGYFDQRYETFDYNTQGSELTIEGYSGQSTDLVIPATIGGKVVTALGDNFVDSLTNVKSVYIPSTISEIKGDVDENVTIYCYDSTAVYQEYLAIKEAKETEKAAESQEQNSSEENTSEEGTDESTGAAQEQESEKDWHYELIYDSDFVNFNLGDLPFEYNINGATAEVTRYTGKEDLIVIPSYINGYPVTNVSMNLLGTANLTVIPETVKVIAGTSSKLIYSPVFAIELVMSLLAIALALLTVNVLLPRYRKDTSEYLLTGGQMVSVVLYVIAQLGFAIAAIYYISVSPFLALVISLVILAVFVIFVFSAGIGRSHAKAVTKNIAEKTSRMKAIKESTKGMDEIIADPEAKKQVHRLIEEIRYSDPMSRQDLDDIESDIERAIDDIKIVISKENYSDMPKLVDETMKLVQKRNLMCKNGK